MNSKFSQQKNSVLSKMDKSSKGDWDEKIISLCEKINNKENYYTTSSCSGRVVLLMDKDKKREGLFLKVWHDLIEYEDLKEILDEVISSTRPPLKFPAYKISQINKKLLIKNLDDGRAGRGATNRLIKFKQEPPIFHVACRTIEDAFKILSKARLAGFKRSGIISGGNRFVVEIIGTEKLEFPIVGNRRLLADSEFLKLVVKKSNENLKKGWGKINELEKIFNRNG